MTMPMMRSKSGIAQGCRRRRRWLVQGVQKRAHGRVRHQGESQSNRLIQSGVMKRSWLTGGPCWAHQMAPAKHTPASNDSPRRWSNWSAGVAVAGSEQPVRVQCELRRWVPPERCDPTRQHRNGGQGNGCGQREAPSAEYGFSIQWPRAGRWPNRLHPPIPGGGLPRLL